MPHFVTQLGQAAAGSPDLFQALGIDGRMLIFQIIGFLVLVLFMGKFVFPVLNKSIDKREAAIRDSVKAAEKARNDAAEAEKRIQKQLDDAKKQAADAIAVAQKEADAMLVSAEEKAKKRADHIVSQAESRMEQEIIAARKALRSETAELVALATEKVLSQKVDAKTDAKLIEQAIKEAK